MKAFKITLLLTIIVGFIYRGAQHAAHAVTPQHDYQLDIHHDSVWLWDGSRLAGKCGVGRIDSLILNDNQ